MAAKSELPILLGDSQFKRLFRNHSQLFDSLSSDTCIGGDTIRVLHARCKLLRTQLSRRKVVVLIGANDILRGNSSANIRKSFKALVRYLRRLQCIITICEVLPIPKLGRLATDCKLVLDLNKYIRSFEPSGIRVIHTHDQFVADNNIIKRYLYCSTIKTQARVTR